MEKKIQIYTVTHKQYSFPKDKMYNPVIAGAFEYNDDSFPTNYLRDDIGDNISMKHDLYSEYTALYWIWKNSLADVVGLNHYRRYFISGGWIKYIYCIMMPKRNVYKAVLNIKQIRKLLNKGYDCILPKKQWRVERTLEQEFYDGYGKALLNATEEVIKDILPQYLQTYYSVMSAYENYQKCICIMKREYFNEYSEWIFSIFSKLEERGYGNSDREFAYLGERLLNVWVEYEKKNNTLQVKELFYVNTEASFLNFYNNYTEFYIPIIFRPFFRILINLGLWKKH